MKLLNTLASLHPTHFCRPQISLWNREAIAKAFFSIAITFSTIICSLAFTCKICVICPIAAFSYFISRIIIQKYFHQWQRPIPKISDGSFDKAIEQKVKMLSSSFHALCKRVHLEELRNICLYIEKHRERHIQQAKKAGQNLFVHTNSELPKPLQFNTDGTVFIHFTKLKKGDYLIGRGAIKVTKFAINYEKGFLFASSAMNNSLPEQYGEIELKGVLLTEGINNVLPAFYPVRYIGKKGKPKMRILTPYANWTLEQALNVLPFTLKDRISLALQLLNALVAFQKKKLLHRDLKEDNMFVFFNDNHFLVAIGDLGSMCKMDAEDVPLRKKNQTSPRYVSPEFATAMINGTDLSLVTNEKLDIWSMGLVLYFLLYPNRYFDLPAKSDFNRNFVYKSISNLDENWVPMGLRKPTLTALESLIREMLQVDPKNRIGPRQLADYVSSLNEKTFL